MRQRVQEHWNDKQTGWRRLNLFMSHRSGKLQPRPRIRSLLHSLSSQSCFVNLPHVLIGYMS